MPGVRFLLACLKLCSKLPYRAQMRMGSFAGRIIYHWAATRRAVAATNLELCFPDLSHGERRELLRAHFTSLGRALFETGLAYWAPDDRLRGLLKISGLENLRTARSRGKGVILIAAHFTSMELCGRLLGFEVDYDAVIRPFSNPDLAAVVQEGRQRAVKAAIPKDDFRRFLKGLRDNRTALITVDQASTAGSMVMAPFFGIPAPTSVNAARIARKTGAVLLPLLWLREPDLSGYRVELAAELPDFPTGDAQKDGRRLNALVEEQVRLAPEQYYWIHRRFKAEPSPYD